MRTVSVKSPMGSVYATVDDEFFPLAQDVSWYLGTDGYVQARDSDGRTFSLHRQVLGLRRGDGLEGDHLNLDKLDNRAVNLRIVTHAQNMQNKPPYRTHKGKPCSSSYRGVGRHPKSGKWTARVTLDGKTHNLGEYDDEQEAALVAAEGRRRLLKWSTA